MTPGYIKPVVIPEHRIFGASATPFIVYQPDGNWFDSRPSKELQARRFETYGCIAFNTLAQVEAFMYKVYGIIVNYSDRWLGIIAVTRPPGNDPVKIYDAIRDFGLIPEDMLPFSDDLENVDEYYSFKGADEAKCRAEGLRWKEKWDFQHDWVFTENQPLDEKINNMKVALKSSPLTGDFYAWYQDDRGVYVRIGGSNHWSFILSYKDFQNLEDSYEPTLKDVDQEIFFCKRIYIGKKPMGVVTEVIPPKSFWQKLWTLLLSIIK